MEWIAKPDRSAALAGAVGGELNDHLTLILNSLALETPGPENLAAAERATLRCALIARGLTLYAQRYGGGRRSLPLSSVLDEDLM